MLQFLLQSSGLTAVTVLFVWCATWTWIIWSDVCILPDFIWFFLYITYMSVVCLFCMCIRMLVQSISVFFACCVFMGLAAWNKMDDDDSVDRCSSTDACGLSLGGALAEGRRLISSACNFVAVVTISHRVAQRARVIGRVADGQEFPTRFFPPVRRSLPPPIQSSNRP